MEQIIIGFSRSEGHSSLPVFRVMRVDEKEEHTFLGWDDVAHFILSEFQEIKDSTKITTIYEEME